MRVVAIAVLMLASSASADVLTEDVIKAATALFEQGRQLLEAGKEAEACDKFEASLRLDPQIGTKLNVAACRENKGRALEAYRLFEEAALEAARTSKQAREVFARQRMQQLEPKLVRVTLRIADTPGAVVRLETSGFRGETRELARGLWTKTQVVGPGPIVVAVSAPDRVPVRIERAGTVGTEVVIDVPVLEPIAKVVAPIEDRPVETPARSRTPWIVGGVGVALLAGSGVLGLHARSRYNEAKAAVDLAGVDAAQQEADVATVVAIAGAVAVGVGVVLYVRGRSTAITPTAGAGTVGLGVVGSF